MNLPKPHQSVNRTPVGAVMFFMGLGILFLRKEDLSQIKGDCPYCILPIEGVYSQKSITCSHCKQNIIFKKGYFLTTAAATNLQLSLPDRTDLMIPPVASNNATLKWTVVVAALVIGGIIVAAQIDWSRFSPQPVSVITPTVDEPKTEPFTPKPPSREKSNSDTEIDPPAGMLHQEEASGQSGNQDVLKSNEYTSAQQQSEFSDGSLFVVHRFTASTKDGLHGFDVGKKVTLVREEGDFVVISTGDTEVRTEKSNLSNDPVLFDKITRGCHALFRR